MNRLVFIVCVSLILTPFSLAGKGPNTEGKEVKTLTQLADKSEGTLESAMKAGAETFDSQPIRKEGYFEILEEKVLKTETIRVPSRYECRGIRHGIRHPMGFGLYDDAYGGAYRSGPMGPCDYERGYTQTVTHLQQKVRLPDEDRDAYVSDRTKKGILKGIGIGILIGAFGFLASITGGLVLMAMGTLAGASLGFEIANDKARNTPKEFPREIKKTVYSHE